MKAIHMTIGILISLLLIASIVLVLGFGPSTVPPVQTTPPSVTPVEGFCTLDAKICPDGSSVGRTMPSCDFAPCPGEEASRSAQQQAGGYQIIAQDEGLSGGLEERRTVTVFNQEDLTALWNEIYAAVEPRPPVPSVDFATNAVVGYFTGIQASGGYSVEVASIQKAGTTTQIIFKQTNPGQDCMASSVITKPYILISVPNDGAQFNVQVTQETRSCM